MCDAVSTFWIESRVERVFSWDANFFTLSRQLGVKVDFSMFEEPDCRTEVDGLGATELELV